VLWTFVTCSSDDRVVELCVSLRRPVALHPVLEATQHYSECVWQLKRAARVANRRQMACEKPDCTVPAIGQLPATLARMSALHTLCAPPYQKAYLA